MARGHKVVARWNYTTPRGEKAHSLELGNAGRTESAVTIAKVKPEELVMRGVALECIPTKPKA